MVENEFTFFEIFQIHSAKLVKESVRTTVNDQVGWRGHVGRVIWV